MSPEKHSDKEKRIPCAYFLRPSGVAVDNLDPRVKEGIVNLAGMAEAEIGKPLLNGLQGDVSVCVGEGPRADICVCGMEVSNLNI